MPANRAILRVSLLLFVCCVALSVQTCDWLDGLTEPHDYI
jgi:hypothetical protein